MRSGGEVGCSRGALGLSWGALAVGGALLGYFGARGPAGGPPIWGLLGPSWRPLGAVLGPFGLQNRFWMVKKSFQISIQKLMHLGIDF